MGSVYSTKKSEEVEGIRGGTVFAELKLMSVHNIGRDADDSIDDIIMYEVWTRYRKKRTAWFDKTLNARHEHKKITLKYWENDQEVTKVYENHNNGWTKDWKWNKELHCAPGKIYRPISLEAEVLVERRASVQTFELSHKVGAHS